jgi:DNA-directed RNA polymerase specialized sigma24 family protein
MRKNNENLHTNPVFIEQERGPLKIIEEFAYKLGELDRKVFIMYLDDASYAEMSAALGVDEANLRERVSRIEEHLKTRSQEPGARIGISE